MNLIRRIFSKLYRAVLSKDSKKASNREFVIFCFRTILGREPDEKEVDAYLQALDEKTFTKEQTVVKILLSEEFTDRNKNNEFFPLGHYYSAIPSLEDRLAFLNSPSSEEEIPGVSLNANAQFELLQRFKKYYVESPFRDYKSGNLRYYYINPSYSYTDALTLYCMVREFKPRRVIEIGSGFSSCVMLDTSELFFDNKIIFTFIDPFPDLLYSLIKDQDKEHSILPLKLQDVDINIFRSLKANDILFVDSTHVSKLGSDVNRIVFQILPNLQKGVLVHFHDVFWPFEYPLDWIKKGIAWNEAYLLRAFMEFNDKFEIVFFSSFLHKYHQDWFQKNMPLYLKNSGGNIWIRKQ